MSTPQKRRILLIEDTEEDAHLFKALLEAEGYQVEWVDHGSKALQAFEEFEPDLVILDLVLPPDSPNGFEICRQIRAKSEVPILLVTVRSEEVDTVVGLELGADDYLVKPVRHREFIARVRAILRRAVIAEKAAAQKKHLSYPRLEIDLPTRTVLVDGEEVHLTPKEFDLLFKLASNPRKVFTREELIQQVWGYPTPGGDLRTIDTHIKRLRKKLQEGRTDLPWSIATVWGVGYRFDFRE